MTGSDTGGTLAAQARALVPHLDRIEQSTITITQHAGRSWTNGRALSAGTRRADRARSNGPTAWEERDVDDWVDAYTATLLALPAHPTRRRWSKRTEELADLADSFTDADRATARRVLGGKDGRGFRPDLVAECMADIACGFFGDDFLRKHLTLEWVYTRGALTSWRPDRARRLAGRPAPVDPKQRRSVFESLEGLLGDDPDRPGEDDPDGLAAYREAERGRRFPYSKPDGQHVQNGRARVTEVVPEVPPAPSPAPPPVETAAQRGIREAREADERAARARRAAWEEQQAQQQAREAADPSLRETRLAQNRERGLALGREWAMEAAAEARALASAPARPQTVEPLNAKEQAENDEVAALLRQQRAERERRERKENG